jgi:IS66 C-terminal element
MTTLIMTAKLNDVDPQAWLADVRQARVPLTQPRFQSSQNGRALFLAYAQTLFGAQAVTRRLNRSRHENSLIGRSDRQMRSPSSARIRWISKGQAGKLMIEPIVEE